MNRKLIASIIAAMSVIALGAIIYVFTASLNPSERSLAGLPRVAIPKLEPGRFIFVKNPAAVENWPTDILFVRKQNGKLDIWEVPTKDGKHVLPDLQWWRQGQLCNQFLPNFKTGIISCEDSNLGDWAKQNYQWNIDGKNLGQSGVADMMRVPGIEESGEYVLYKTK